MTMQHDDEVVGVEGVGDALPEGWIWTTLGEVATYINGRAFKPSEWGDSGLPIIRIQNLTKSNLVYNYFDGEVEEKYYVNNGDLLISWSATLDAFVWRQGKAILNQHIFRVEQDHRIIEKSYLYYIVKAFLHDLKSKVHGSGMQHITKRPFEETKIPLAPLAEQKRIVEAIEGLFTQLDMGVAALKRLRANLRRYKAAVLKAACEGRLVPQDPDDEPASDLLGRILAERRAKWAAEQRAKGKDPRKLKYEEPAAPDTSDLPELPEGWVWASVEEVCERIVDCLHSTPVFHESGFICIDTNCIKPGRIVSEKIRYVDEETFHDRNRRMKPEPNDIMFSREGALLGVAVRVPDNLDLCLGQRMMIFRLHCDVDAHYYEYVLNSLVFRHQYASKISGSASPHLNITEIRKMGIPLPPKTEQTYIVTQIELLMSVADELENSINANLKRAERLRQAILKRAFAGQLVAQDPDDEPASELLKRVRRRTP